MERGDIWQWIGIWRGEVAQKVVGHSEGEESGKWYLTQYGHPPHCNWWHHSSIYNYASCYRQWQKAPWWWAWMGVDKCCCACARKCDVDKLCSWIYSRINITSFTEIYILHHNTTIYFSILFHTKSSILSIVPHPCLQQIFPLVFFSHQGKKRVGVTHYSIWLIALS